MNYKIRDNHHILRLSLTSNEQYSPKLKVYINDSESASRQYNSTTNSSPFVYNIDLSAFEVGDVISKITLTQKESIKPWQTHEGIKILLDGEEVATINSNTYNLEGFKNAGEHDIQAVYVGNNELNPSWTDKYHFTVTQPEIEESSTPSVDGVYTLVFLDNTIEECNYGESKEIRLQLLKGGVPVGAGKVVEKVTGGRGVGSQQTNSKGIVTLTTGKYENDQSHTAWDVGKYKIGGYYTANSRDICSVYKNFEVKKVKSKIEIDGGYYTKGDKILFRFYYGENIRLPNTSVQLYVNGKLIDKKTSPNGVVSYRFGSLGTFKFKAVYKGTKNIEKSELTTTITISE